MNINKKGEGLASGKFDKKVEFTEEIYYHHSLIKNNRDLCDFCPHGGMLVLEGIRKKRNSMMILLVFAAIIIVFIFWGVGPTGDGGNAVAVVDGETITTQDYLNTYRNEYEYYRRNFQGEFNEQVAEEMGLKKRALDIIINRTLVVEAARDEGVRVADEEVQRAIMAMPVFQEAGVFNKQRYFDVLSANRLKPGDFEDGVMHDLLAQKMRERVISNVTVTEGEVRDAYMAENRQVDLRYVEVQAGDFTEGVEVTEDQARAYLEENSEQFLVPTKIRAYYAWVDYEDLAGRVAPTEEEIREYYEANPSRFETAPEVRASHILVRPESRDPEGMEAARARAAELLELLKAGEDFSELARTHSGDPGTAKKGGDLGWFPRGMMVKPFEDAAFSLGKGEVSDVVETPFGFHIIRVDDMKPTGVKPFEAVKGDIRKILTRGKIQAEAEKVLEPLAGDFRAAETVEELDAAVEGESLVQGDYTGLVVETGKSVELMRNQRIEDTIFTMRPGEVSNPVEADDRLYLIKLVERISSHVPPYVDIKEKVDEAVKTRLAYDAALEEARDLIEDLKEEGATFEGVASDHGLDVGTTGFFSRAEGFMPGLGLFVGDRPDLFTLTGDDPVYPMVLSTDSAHYVFALNEAKEADPAGLEDVSGELRERLLAEKREDAFIQWLGEIRKGADIKVYPERM